eukprot:2385490-Prymnesium_polylepis.1
MGATPLSSPVLLPRQMRPPGRKHHACVEHREVENRCQLCRLGKRRQDTFGVNGWCKLNVILEYQGELVARTCEGYSLVELLVRTELRTNLVVLVGGVVRLWRCVIVDIESYALKEGNGGTCPIGLWICGENECRPLLSAGMVQPILPRANRCCAIRMDLPSEDDKALRRFNQGSVAAQGARRPANQLPARMSYSKVPASAAADIAPSVPPPKPPETTKVCPHRGPGPAPCGCRLVHCMPSKRQRSEAGAALRFVAATPAAIPP